MPLLHYCPTEQVSRTISLTLHVKSAISRRERRKNSPARRPDEGATVLAAVHREAVAHPAGDAKVCERHGAVVVGVTAARL